MNRVRHEQAVAERQVTLAIRVGREWCAGWVAAIPARSSLLIGLKTVHEPLAPAGNQFVDSVLIWRSGPSNRIICRRRDAHEHGARCSRECSIPGPRALF